jgi:phosphoribosylanthranilate isomerase
MFFHRGKKIKVKICGIRDEITAKAAVDAGADALGFIFVPRSKRYIHPRKAQSIIASLPPGIDAVGVFVNSPPNMVYETAVQCKLSAIQLHGEEDPHHYSQAGLPVVKCIKVRNKSNLDKLNSFKADAILLDSYHPLMAGGSGRPFNWSIWENREAKLPLILAGGLTIENVCTAIKTVQPNAVDVSSGVETNGIKDIRKIETFIVKVKEANI